MGGGKNGTSDEVAPEDVTVGLGHGAFGNQILTLPRPGAARTGAAEAIRVGKVANRLSAAVDYVLVPVAA